MNPTSNPDLVLEQVYKDDYCQISISTNYYCICQYYYHLPLSRDLLNPALEFVLSQARQWFAAGISVFYLVEVLNGQLLPSEDITWFRKDAIPQLADAGISYLAYVSENNLFRNFSQGNQPGSALGKVLNLRIFQDKEDALLWLAQIKTTI